MNAGFELATALYACAALLGWRRSGTQGAGRAVIVLLSLGALLQALGFVQLHGRTPPVPLESFPAALALMAWLTVVTYLLSLSLARFREVGTWVAGLAALVSAGASLGLRLRPALAVVAEDGRALSHAHVLFSAAGFSLLLLASLAGAAYLTKERDLKAKRGPRFALPSLESLDRVEHVMLALGFTLLTLGVGTGFVWSAERGMTLWTGHALWLLGAWVIYLVPVGLRVVQRQHGPRPARTVVVGFIVLACSYIGVRLLGGGI